jgi:hypothetical protein
VIRPESREAVETLRSQGMGSRRTARHRILRRGASRRQERQDKGATAGRGAGGDGW